MNQAVKRYIDGETIAESEILDACRKFSRIRFQTTRDKKNNYTRRAWLRKAKKEIERENNSRNTS